MLLGWCLIYVASTYGVSSSHYLTFPVTLFAMTKTPGAMHVAKITNRRVDKSGQPREYVSHLLRRTYRDGAAVKHETLANLSPWPQAAIEAVRAALAGKTLVVAGEGLEVTGSLPHGHVAAVHAQAKALGLPALLGPGRPSPGHCAGPDHRPGMPARPRSWPPPGGGPTPRWPRTWAWTTPPPTRSTRRWTGLSDARTPSSPSSSGPT